MAKNEAKIQFTADCKEFNAQIQKANSTMQELRAELRLNETQMKANGVSVESLESRHKILSDQLSVSESKTEALTQKVNKAAEIFGENSNEVSKLRTQLLNAQTAEEKIRQAISVCNSQLDAQKSAMNQAKSASQQLADTISEQQTELNQLKSEYADAVLQYGKNSKEAKTLAKEIDTLSSELDANQKKMSNVESAADKLDNSLDNVDDTAEKVSEGFTVLKGAMADLLADGIENIVSGLGEIGTEAFTMANDVTKGTNTFIAKTGESKDKAGEFEEVMTSIYNGNYGESFEDIADAMATVKTSMGDIGTAELESLTTKALVLRDTFDMDVNESIRAVNSMMDQFGITADEAYTLIAQGAQNGLNQNGDLLDTVNEYSVQFKNAGYSAEDMFNMLTNGVDAGTWSVDKLGDAVKEFNIRASDGTVGDAIKENAKAFGLTKQEAETLASEVGTGSVGAYQKLADKLREVDDDTQRYQLGVSMFGTMWEDLGEEAVFALLDTQGEISTTSDALDDINSVKYDDLGSAIEGIKRNLQTSVAEPIKDEVMPAVNEFVENVDWQGVGQTIGDVMGTVVEGMFALVDGTKQAVQWMNEHKAVMATVATVIGIVATAIAAYNVVQGIKTAMDAAQVTTIWGLVAAHWAQATAAMAALAPYILVVAAIAAVIAIIVLCVKYWDEIVEAVKNCWDAVCETLSGWGEWINTNVIQPIVEFFKDLWDGIVEIFQSVVDWVKNNWKSIVLFIINPFAGVFNYFYENFEWFREFVDGVVSAVKEFFINLWNDISNAFTTAWDGIMSFFSSIPGWIDTNVIQPIVNFFVGLWESLKQIWDTICNVIQVAFMFIGSIISAAFDIITLPFRFIWENCKEYVFAAWEWIKQKVTTAINAVKTVITTVWNAVKNVFTTVWNGIKNVVGTVWEWIKSKITTVINNVKNTISTVWNAVKTVTSTVFNAVKSVVTTVWNAIKNAVTTVVNAVKAKVTAIWNSIKSVTSTVFNAVKSVATSVWNSIKNAVTTVVNNVKNTVTNVWNAIKNATSTAFNAVKNTASNVWNSIKTAISNVVNGVKSTISNVWNGIKSTTSNVFNGIKSTATNVWNNIKNAITTPIEAAKEKIRGIIDSIKGFFSGLKLKFPNIKLPHFSIKGSFSLSPPSVPKLSIDWYKDGGIMMKPTIFGFNGSSFMAGGEAGAEAILPIDRLEGYISGAIEKAQNVVNFDTLAAAIEDLANRPVALNINGRQFAYATASDTDSVGGMRNTFKSRGLAVD